MVIYTATPLGLREGNILDLSFASQVDVDALKQRTAPGEGVSDFLKQAVYDVLGFRPLLTARADAARAAEAGAETALAPALEAAAAAAAELIVLEPVTVEAYAAEPTMVELSVVEEPEFEPTEQEAPEPTAPDAEPPFTAGATWETVVVTDSEPETKRAAQTKPPPQAKRAVETKNTPATKVDTDTEPAREAKAAEAKAAETKAAAPQRQPAVANPDEKQRYGESVVREILGASFIEEQIVPSRGTPGDN